MKYRIKTVTLVGATQNFSYYIAQFKGRWWPFWDRMDVKTFSSFEDAKDFIERYKSMAGESYDYV